MGTVTYGVDALHNGHGDVEVILFELAEHEADHVLAVEDCHGMIFRM